jgi:outer membrane receptor protein involved in Fe transport
MNDISNKSDLFPGHRKTIAIAVSTVLAGSNTAQAQMTLEEVIVTATKREESLQDIPMSVTAFTDEMIVHEGFKQINDYAGKIPGLTVNTREPGGANVIMRGCAVASVNFGGTATTSVYLDEQPITSAGFNPDPRLVDISRVEALSGPQGTLFGDAAQCGTLRIITNKPDASEVEGWVDVTGSKIDDGDLGYDVSAMANIPLIEDKLALRIVGFHAEEAGFIDNISVAGLPGPFGPTSGAAYNNSTFAEDDINSADVNGGRVSLRWTPNENLTIDAQAIYQKTDVDGFGDVDLNEGAHAGFGIGTLEQVRYGEEKFKDEWYQLALTAEANLGFADVMATGAYMKRKTRYDVDSTAYAFVYAQDNGTAYSFYDFGERTHFSSDDSNARNWSFEARVSTPADSDSRWAGIVGFFYNKSKDHTVFTANGVGLADGCTTASQYDCAAYSAVASSRLHYYYFGTFGPEASDNWWTGDYFTTSKDIAVFGEISFDVTENFTITAGGRWFEVKEDIFNANGPTVNLTSARPVPTFICDSDGSILDNWQTNGVPSPTFVHTCFNETNAKSKESDWVPKINGTWNFADDKLVYFTYSEGFRRGGVNSAKQGSFAAGGALHAYNSDSITNYEMGFKSTWMGGTFRLNATFYHMIWEDIQIQVNDPNATFFSLGILNLAEAEIDGVEANFEWLPSDGWSISGNLGYNDASLSEEIVDPILNLALPKGERLPLMSKWKTSMTAEYTFNREIFGAEPYAMTTWEYRGNSLNTLAGLGGTTSLNTVKTHPSYSTVDLRFGLNHADWTTTLYIDNVFNDHSSTLFNTRWIQERSTMNQPRTFGINFRKNFFGK